jgi:hypothetical protein
MSSGPVKFRPALAAQGGNLMAQGATRCAITPGNGRLRLTLQRAWAEHHMGWQCWAIAMASFND